ncbi:MAG: hypothetical protein PUF72_11470 [Clostridiales bacterium]|nr:hypothetical protein [Clostridiales bacterium]
MEEEVINMRETTKMTVPYQFMNIFFAHLAAVGIIMILTLMAFLWVLEKSVIKEIMSVILIICYGLALYSRAAELSRRDNKPYSRLKPDMKKGVMFGVVIAATNFVMILLMKLGWVIWGTPEGMGSVWGVVMNAVFWFWTSPYSGIMGLSRGMMTWYSYVLLAAVPTAATTLGYWAGCKGFELTSVLLKFQYEKKKSK